jgi:MoxR-like ATPase
MQERQITIGKQTYTVPDPFLVLATQNPIESDGTYALPEAQVDRFMFKVLVGYPTHDEELAVIQRVTGPEIQLRTLLTPRHLKEMQEVVARVYVDPRVTAYAATLVGATRKPAEHGLSRVAGAIQFGASPRASINLILAGRALAFLRGRQYVLPQDVAEIAPDVIRHRLVLSYEGIASGVTSETILAELLGRFPPPRIDLGDRHAS